MQRIVPLLRANPAVHRTQRDKAAQRPVTSTVKCRIPADQMTA
jgi:hypothetical protein